MLDEMYGIMTSGMSWWTFGWGQVCPLAFQIEILDQRRHRVVAWHEQEVEQRSFENAAKYDGQVG